MEPVGLLDAGGRRRSAATLPGHRRGQAPRNKGMRYPADPPTVEEIVLVMRDAGDRAHGLRLRGLAARLKKERPSSCAATIARACSTNWSRNARPGESSIRPPVSYDQWRLFSGSSTPPSVPCETG